MKIFYILLLLLVSCIPNKVMGQFVINSKFKPLSYEELVLETQAKAAQRAYNEQEFLKYQEIAYSYWQKGDYKAFIYYSNFALNTGWYNNKMFYDRGRAFEILHNYKSAKKEYKKAKKKGYYPAVKALEQCRNKEKYNRQK